MVEKQVILGMGLLMLVFTVATAGCLGGEDEEEGEDDIIITVNGEDISVSSIFEDHDPISVESGGETFEGVPLDDLVDGTGLSNPGDYQYKITASDGWNQDVTWENMQEGVLVEEDTMTAFPGLPGKYRIRDVVKIEPVNVKTIEVNGVLYTWKQPFHIIDDPVEMTDEENNTLTGVYLSEVVNITGLADPDAHDYNLIGGDGYNQTVAWEDMTAGLLDEENMKCYFPHLSKKYHISDISVIEVM